MKLLMENWRAYLNEEPQVLTEEELNELLQEIGALKSMLGRVRGGKKFAGGYGWEAAVEQWEDEDAQKAAQETGIPGVKNKEDFVAQVKALDAKAQTSKNPKAKKAIQDLTTNIAQTAEPEDAKPDETPQPADPEPEETGPGMLARAGASIGRGADKAKQAMLGTDEDPTALGKAAASAGRGVAHHVFGEKVPLEGYSNDKNIVDTLNKVNMELRTNDIELTNKELRKIMPYLVDQLEDNKLSEGLISEADAWETLKHLASKFGRMEKGGKIIGRGKADKENKAKVEAALSKPATILIRDLRDKLEKIYPGFPNTEGTSEFGMAVVEIWMVYDSIVEGVKNEEMEPIAANALIRALYDLVDRYKNYVLADVGRHFTEATASGVAGDSVAGRVLGQNVPGHVGGIPITDPALKGMKNQAMARSIQTAQDAAAPSMDAAQGEVVPQAMQDALNDAFNAEENAYMLKDAMLDAGVDDTVATALSGVSDLPREEIVDMAYKAAAKGPEAWNEFIKWKIENAPQMHFNLLRADHLSKAWETGSVSRDFVSMEITGNTAVSNSQWEMAKNMFDMGRGNDPGPAPQWASEFIADADTVKAIAKATGRQASRAAVRTAEALPAQAQAAAEAVVDQGDPLELAQKAIEQIEPDKAEAVAQAIEKTIGSGATELAGLEAAGFLLKAVGIPAFIYSKAAIKLLRAKGKHSSRERELTKLSDGIDVVPEREGEAKEETNINKLGIQIADIVGKDVGSKLYKQLGSELRRLGYEDVLNEKIAKAQIIDLSNIEIPPDQFDAVAKLLLKGLQPTGFQINLGGKVLNAGEYAPKAEQGVDLSGISDIIINPKRANTIKRIIYNVLKDKRIPVKQSDLKESKILARWIRLAVI